MNFLNLKAVLSLNGSGFALGLKRAESQSKAFAKEIKGQFAQAFGTAAIVAYSNKLINLADNITDTADRLDISTKAFQEWSYAAQKSGSSIEKVTSFLDNLAKARERALGGDAGDIANFAAFGVTDLTASTDQIGRQIGRSIAGGNLNRNALQALGGRGAGELIPTLQSLDELSEAAHKAGRVMTDETLEALKALKNEAAGLLDLFAGPMSKALIIIGNRIRDAMTAIKAGVATGAAFFGALSGGAGLKGAYAAANSAFDSVVSEWEANRDKISARAANRQAGVGSMTPDILHDASPIKQAAERAARSSASMSLPGLTSWQTAGAAIRFNPDRQVLDRIAKSTEQTARNTEPNQKPGVAIENLGGGFQ